MKPEWPFDVSVKASFNVTSIHIPSLQPRGIIPQLSSSIQNNPQEGKFESEKYMQTTNFPPPCSAGTEKVAIHNKVFKVSTRLRVEPGGFLFPDVLFPSYQKI